MPSQDSEDWTSCAAVLVKVVHHQYHQTISLLVVAIVGTIEELAASQRTLTLVRDQVETNFFGPINMIKAALPGMRERKSGHIMVLTGISLFSFTQRCMDMRLTY